MQLEQLEQRSNKATKEKSEAEFASLRQELSCAQDELKGWVDGAESALEQSLAELQAEKSLIAAEKQAADAKLESALAKAAADAKAFLDQTVEHALKEAADRSAVELQATRELLEEGVQRETALEAQLSTADQDQLMSLQLKLIQKEQLAAAAELQLQLSAQKEQKLASELDDMTQQLIMSKRQVKTLKTKVKVAKAQTAQLKSEPNSPCFTSEPGEIEAAPIALQSDTTPPSVLREMLRAPSNAAFDVASNSPTSSPPKLLPVRSVLASVPHVPVASSHPWSTARRDNSSAPMPADGRNSPESADSSAGSPEVISPLVRC